MKIGVTGGRGFIGHHLVSELLNRGFEVVVLDNGYRVLHSFSEHAGLKVCNGDVRHLRDLKFFADCEVVINLAAVSAVMVAEQNPTYTYETNVQGVANLLEFCRPRGIRVVQASSREVYGEVNKLPVHESNEYAPINCYGMSKAMAEKLLLDARHQGAKVSILRLANVIGTGDEEPRVLPAFLKRAGRGLPLKVFGGKQVIDFVPVEQVVQAFVMATAGDVGPVHVASGKATSILDLTRRITKLWPETKVEFLPPRGVEVTGFQADIKRMVNWGVYPPEDPLESLPTLAEHYALKAVS